MAGRQGPGARWGRGRGRRPPRCRRLSLPPGNPAPRPRLEGEKAGGEAGSGWTGGPRRRGRRAARTPGSSKGRGLRARPLPPGGQPPPLTTHTHTHTHPSPHTHPFIPSTHAHSSGPVCARHCAGRGGWPGKMVNAALSDRRRKSLRNRDGNLAAAVTRLPEKATFPL